MSNSKAPKSVGELPAVIAQMAQSIGKVGAQTLTLFKNGSGYLVVREGRVPFSDPGEAALLLTNPGRLEDTPSTPGQLALKNRHGTPRAFARSVMACLGEISLDEARAAIDRYNDEWVKAGRE